MITNSRGDQQPRRAAAWLSRVSIVAAATLLAAGCSSSTGSSPTHTASATPAAATPTTSAAPAAPAAAHGVEAAITDVPWAQVGRGWTLAMWSPVTPHMPGDLPGPNEPTPETASTTLYLVDPTGNRYAITTFPPGDRELGLLDWSGDGSHALFAGKYAPVAPSMISVDLHTGTQTTIPVAGLARFTRPDGKAILLSTSSDGNIPGMLKRIDLAGNEQLSYPTDQLAGAAHFSGDYLESLDGTQLVLGTARRDAKGTPTMENGLVVMGNDGKVIRDLPSPMPQAECSPVRWWAPTVVLASCRADAGGQLWEVPLDGTAPTALTAVNSGQEDDPGFVGDIGDMAAWQLPSGTYLQTEGACGTLHLARLTPDMHTTQVTVPGVSHSIQVAGATADKLMLLAKVGCGGTTSLLAYDPAANTSTVLLGPPVNGGGVTDAQLYPDQK